MKYLESGKIILSSENREEVPIIPIDILNQKYLLHKGFLMIAFNKD